MDRVATQQVVRPPAKAAIFLVLTVEDGAEETVRELMSDLAGLTRSISFRYPDDGLDCVLGIGSLLWDRMFGDPRPKRLHPFVELSGPRHHAPATPGDLLLHVRARNMDVGFELTRQVMKRLRGHVQVVDETHGFKYFDDRDLLGFVDGSENPEGDDALAAVTIGDEDPDFAGGSYVIVQKYVHDLVSWESITVDEQERVIGRSKLENIEMPDDIQPANSHVAVNQVLDDDGDEIDILRANMPFGEFGSEEFGTYFIGYASDPDVIEQMLQKMFLGDPPGNTDRILDFSTALTGTLFFIPTAGFLDDVPDGPGASASPAPAASEDQQAPADLGIGSLKHTHGF